MTSRASPESPPDAPSEAGARGRVRRALAQAAADCGIANLPLNWRFRLIVMALAVPFLGYVVWSASQTAALEKQYLREEARANAALLAARFEDHVEQIDRLLATAAQPIGSNIGDIASINALLQNMRAFVPKTVDNIGVWSLDGNIMAALDKRAVMRAVNVSDRRYFTEAIARRDLSYEGPIMSRTSGVAIIQFARPIFDGQNRIVGVLTMSLRPSDLTGLIDQATAPSDTTLVTIVGRNGIVVGRSVDPSLWIGKPVPDVDALNDVFARGTGTHEELGADGRNRLAGFAVVGKWPWAVTVGEPVDKVLGPTSDRLLRNLGIGIAMLALAFALAGRIAAWTGRPLMQLADDTERLRSGELSHRSSVVTGGEIALLAANFNSMAAALEERDQALAASRQQLNAIADNVPAQVYYIDREERYRYVNGYRGLFAGMSAAEMIGKTVREVRGDAVYEILGPQLHRALDGIECEFEAVRELDGRTYHFLHAYVPDRDEHGDVVGIYCFAQDITERKLADLKRLETEKRLVTITDHLPAMICYVDAERRFRFANVAFEKWFDRKLDDIIGQPFDHLMPPEIASQYGLYFLHGMRGEAMEYEMEVPTDGHGSRWLRGSFIPDVDEATGTVRGVYGMVHNVTKAKEAEQRLTRLAQFDTLTGIANRYQFNETLARVLASDRDDPQPLALMFLDIDHFKQVNDRHGHACGDILLKDFAQRLADSVRPTDAVARLSGDEFVILLQGMHSDEEPQFVARKIIAAVEKPFVIDDRVLSVTTSIGIAMRAGAHEDPSVLMKRADEALYEAKRAGRNTFRLAG